MTIRFITEAEVQNLTTLSRSTLWRKSKQGEFPKKYQISKGRSAYLVSEVEDWMRQTADSLKAQKH